MPEQPLISIITVNLNDVEGLKRTMTSASEQTFMEFEYIVIDGGSTDGSKEFIESYSNKIDYWVSEKDSGIYNAMNKGIKMASGEYLLFLNSGDWLFNKKVLDVVSKELVDCDMLYGNIVKAFNDGRRIPENAAIAKDITLKTFFRGSLNHQALFINHKLFEIYGLYDEELQIVSDWKFSLIALGINNSKIKFIDTKISFYDMTGISNDNSLRNVEREKVFKELIPRSIYLDYKYLIQLENDFNSSRNVKFRLMEKHRIARKMNSMLFRIFPFLFAGKL